LPPLLRPLLLRAITITSRRYAIGQSTSFVSQ
jgi:hypothetical protein